MPEEKNKKILEPDKNIGQLKEVNIVSEMQEAYLDYAMSVIISRALPDIRDGLKPVHRRILYAMWQMGLRSSGKFRKSATVVGEVLGKYHPHGDSAVYDSMARMAQDFSLRYTLVHGQGNWGCFTKDTKVKLTDGRSLSFGELIKEAKKGEKNFTYTFNDETKRIEIAEIKRPRLTRKQAELVQVVLDNGEKIQCTPNHRFMLRDGSYKEAQNLCKNESLMPLYSRFSTKEDDSNIVDYFMIRQPQTRKWEWAHHLSDEWNIKNGIYERNRGRIRHHADFNKKNNNPDNIERMNWKEHWKAHYEFMSERHKNDSEYVKKLAEGRRKYIESHKYLFAERARKLNKKLWANSEFRKKQSERIKEMWTDPEYKKRMSEMSSKNLKKLWARPEFQKLLSDLKSKELKNRWQDKKYRKEMAEKMKEISIRLWQDNSHREKISKLSKERWVDPEFRNKQSKISKKLWENPEYRAKYSDNHFSEMAEVLWSNPEMRELHSKKAKKQWQDKEFRQKISKGISLRNKKRCQENPDLMKKLSERAAISLKKKWQNSEYRKQVIKSKILGYVSKLLSIEKEITPDIYEKQRYNNGIPKLATALTYFGDFNEIVENAKYHNHKVVSVKKLKKREDVFDLTIDGTHNFLLDAGIFVHNSIDGDSPAAMRYTEAKMQGIAEELMFDIDKETIDFVPNYDVTQKEPRVLPAKLPNLLLNGSMGIAVGMATNIPPHNLTEVCDAISHLIDNPDCGVDDLMEFVKGPDFPTGGIIFDKNEIKTAYATGRGGIVMQAKTDIQEEDGKFRIIISEIPYQVNKSTLIEKIAELVQTKKIESIRDVRDESSKEGIRIVIELKKDAYPKKVLNRLFVLTQLQGTFHVNMLALVDGIQPKVLTLKNVLEEYIKHRLVVIRRRAEYDLTRARERAHILEGLKIAILKIDQIITTIKKSSDKDEAKVNLIKKFKLTEIQSVAILEMRLQQLANMERIKVEQELKEKQALIKELEDLLKSKNKMEGVLKDEIKEIKEKYGDERKTKVVSHGVKEFKPEDLVPNEPTIVMITQDGYIKRIPPDTFKSQGRGGKGVMGLTTKEEDIVEVLFSTMTHNDLFFFTTRGRVFQLKTYDVPPATRTAKGQALQNFLQLGPNEKVSTVLSFDDISEEKYLVMATKKGLIKKVAISEFQNVRRSGLIAIGLHDDDYLEWVKPSSGNNDIMIVTSQGQAIRFKETNVRAMGRTAAGVRAIRLKKNDYVVGMDVVDPKMVSKNILDLLIVTAKGYGKKTSLKSYKVQGRGGSGIKTANITAKTGEIVRAFIANTEDDGRDMIIISEKGQVIRMKFGGVPSLGRATQGVRLMRFKVESDKAASVTLI